MLAPTWARPQTHRGSCAAISSLPNFADAWLNQTKEVTSSNTSNFNGCALALGQTVQMPLPFRSTPGQAAAAGPHDVPEIHRRHVSRRHWSAMRRSAPRQRRSDVARDGRGQQRPVRAHQKAMSARANAPQRTTAEAAWKHNVLRFHAYACSAVCTRGCSYPCSCVASAAVVVPAVCVLLSCDLFAPRSHLLA